MREMSALPVSMHVPDNFLKLNFVVGCPCAKTLVNPRGTGISQSRDPREKQSQQRDCSARRCLNVLMRPAMFVIRSLFMQTPTAKHRIG